MKIIQFFILSVSITFSANLAYAELTELDPAILHPILSLLALPDLARIQESCHVLKKESEFASGNAALLANQKIYNYLNSFKNDLTSLVENKKDLSAQRKLMRKIDFTLKVIFPAISKTFGRLDPSTEKTIRLRNLLEASASEFFSRILNYHPTEPGKRSFIMSTLKAFPKDMPPALQLQVLSAFNQLNLNLQGGDADLLYVLEFGKSQPHTTEIQEHMLSVLRRIPLHQRRQILQAIVEQSGTPSQYLKKILTFLSHPSQYNVADLKLLTTIFRHPQIEPDSIRDYLYLEHLSPVLKKGCLEAIASNSTLPYDPYRQLLQDLRITKDPSLITYALDKLMPEAELKDSTSQKIAFLRSYLPESVESHMSGGNLEHNTGNDARSLKGTHFKAQLEELTKAGDPIERSQTKQILTGLAQYATNPSLDRSSKDLLIRASLKFLPMQKSTSGIADAHDDSTHEFTPLQDEIVLNLAKNSGLTSSEFFEVLSAIRGVKNDSTRIQGYFALLSNPSAPAEIINTIFLLSRSSDSKWEREDRFKVIREMSQRKNTLPSVNTQNELYRVTSQLFDQYEKMTSGDFLTPSEGFLQALIGQASQI